MDVKSISEWNLVTISLPLCTGPSYFSPSFSLRCSHFHSLFSSVVVSKKKKKKKENE